MTVARMGAAVKPNFVQGSTPIDRILERLDHSRRVGAGRYRAACPSCKGSSRDVLSISEADDGRVLVKCFAACSTPDVLAAVGLELRDLYPPRTPGTRPYRATTRPKAVMLPDLPAALFEHHGAQKLVPHIDLLAHDHQALEALGAWIAACVALEVAHQAVHGRWRT